MSPHASQPTPRPRPGPAVAADRPPILHGVELGLGLLLTVLVVGVHVTFLRCRGGLWRDETQMVNLSTLPTLAETWAALEHDTYPLAWPLLIRGWTAAGPGTTDFGLGVLGFLVGLGIVGTLWYCARRFGRGVPLISLVLFALNPTVFLFGDSLRGYGLGVLTMVLMLGVLWRLVEEPTRNRTLLAAVVAVWAVQASHFNAVVLFAAGMGGAAVRLRRRDWKTAGLIIGIGALAAASLLPYLDPISRQYQWNSIVKYSVGPERLLEMFGEAVNLSGSFMIWVWPSVVVLAVAGCIYRFARPAPDLPANRKDLALFVGVTMIIGTASYLGFLLSSRLPTQVWYYIPIMGLLAVLADAAIHLALGTGAPGRALRLGAVVILVALISSNVWTLAHMRLTNVDRIAAKLEQSADKDDLILINPWWPAITFNRYYHGPTPWLTLPNVGEYRVQRFDLFRNRMAQREPIKPVLDRIAATLSSGHRLWLVGGLDFLRPGEAPGDLPPYPYGPPNEAPYAMVWSRQAGYFLQQHAQRLTTIPIPSDGPVHGYENLPLSMIEGWN